MSATRRRSLTLAVPSRTGFHGRGQLSPLRRLILLVLLIVFGLVAGDRHGLLVQRHSHSACGAVARLPRAECSHRLFRPGVAGLRRHHVRGCLRHLQFPAAPAIPAAAAVSLLLGGLTAALVVGLVFGLPSLRIRGFYLLASTLGAQFFVEWLFNGCAWFSNNSSSGSISAPNLIVGGGRSLIAGASLSAHRNRHPEPGDLGRRPTSCAARRAATGWRCGI